MSKVDAAKFILECENWFETALPIATHKMPTRVILRNGIRFESESIFWADIYVIFSQRIYTPDYLPIEKDDVVVDIGANIGVFAVYAACKTRNTVYAYEPFPDNYDALEQNVRINALSNVKAYRLAVSDKTGVERFFNSGTSQHHHLEKVTSGVTNTYMEVPSITLRDIMDDNHLAQIDRHIGNFLRSRRFHHFNLNCADRSPGRTFFHEKRRRFINCFPQLNRFMIRPRSRRALRAHGRCRGSLMNRVSELQDFNPVLVLIVGRFSRYTVNLHISV